MALTGEVSDLSLGELIEFFCNQRKTGRLKLIYQEGPAYFYLQSGSVVHARIGKLRGIEAVFYALTLPNASFNFSPAFEAPEQTINQPWTSVVLEGLRRMDEGIRPRNPFPDDQSAIEEPKTVDQKDKADEPAKQPETILTVKESVAKPSTHEAFFAHTVTATEHAGRPWSVGLVAGAIVLILAAVGLPWSWYARSKAKAASQAAMTQSQNVVPETPPVTNTETAAATNEAAAATSDSPAATESDAAAKRQRDMRARERAKASESAASLNQPKSPASTAAKAQPVNAGQKRVTVQVTYDENGRVTQASGGDATALRIARQKRFPAGKPGTTTVTIPIN